MSTKLKIKKTLYVRAKGMLIEKRREEKESLKLKGNLRSKKSYAQMKEREKWKKTSHHRPQCAK